MLTNSEAACTLCFIPKMSKLISTLARERCTLWRRQIGGGCSTSSGSVALVLEASSALLCQSSSSSPTLRAMRTSLLLPGNSSKLALGLQLAKKSKILGCFPDSVQYHRLLCRNLCRSLLRGCGSLKRLFGLIFWSLSASLFLYFRFGLISMIYYLSFIWDGFLPGDLLLYFCRLHYSRGLGLGLRMNEPIFFGHRTVLDRGQWDGFWT